MHCPLPNTQSEDDLLLDAKAVAAWLGVSEDWVWDHSTRRAPLLPAIWLSPGALRFRRSAIKSFIAERERLSRIRRKRR
jgi:predicted DNA-binding transcriptional regulator AlpA